jgi:deoxyribose-phosphate aldolase
VTHVFTRKELDELMGAIAAEALRKAKPSPKDEVCDGRPRDPGPARIDPRTIRLTADVRTLAALIDHTLLRPEATRAQIESLCDEALQLGFAAVCVNPGWVPVAAEKLRGSRVRVATVAGFPFGATSTTAKRAEAKAAIIAGATEVDMVMNVGAMKSGDTARVESDIRGVVEVCHAHGAAVKVILENGYLTDQEKVVASKIARKAGADFVKTSTGFGPSGATEADVRLMREAVGPQMGVKAAGGIRNLADALRMLQAGATRLGASSSLAILAEAAALMK